MGRIQLGGKVDLMESRLASQSPLTDLQRSELSTLAARPLTEASLSWTR